VSGLHKGPFGTGVGWGEGKLSPNQGHVHCTSAESMHTTRATSSRAWDSGLGPCGMHLFKVADGSSLQGNSVQSRDCTAV
jgi:hypothetical protein